MKTERVMVIWARIVAIVFVGLVIFALIKDPLPDDTKTTIPSLIIAILFTILYYSPFVYYGFSKKKNSKKMRLIAKIVSVLYSIGLIYVILNMSETYKSYSIELILIVIITYVALGVPLYYFAWRKKWK